MRLLRRRRSARRDPDDDRAAATTSTMRVTGVFKDLPKNSHMKMAMVAASIRSPLRRQADGLTSWGRSTAGSICAAPRRRAEDDQRARCRPGRSATSRRARRRPRVRQPGDDQDWRLVNVRDVHLGEAQDGGETRRATTARTIVTFSIVALLILGMALRQLHQPRHRPRQPAGARSGAAQGARRQRGQLDRAVPRRIDAGRRRSPWSSHWPWSNCSCRCFAAFLDADSKLSYFGAGGVLLPVIGLLLVVGAAGGLYPAFYLSRFQPAQVLKANKSSAEPAGLGRLRNAAGRRAVRGLDRPDHLHRDRLRADRLRPHRRSRLSSATA